jgi:uncharacterized protein (UPF0335 family)
MAKEHDDGQITEVVSDVARLEEKINAITDRLKENTEITQENLTQLHEVKTVLRVMEMKIHHLEKTDKEHTEIHEKAQESKREWSREIFIAILAFALGIIAKWVFGV